MKGESKQIELRWWFRNDRAMGTSETVVTIENIGYISYEKDPQESQKLYVGETSRWRCEVISC